MTLTLDKHSILKQKFGFDSFRGKQAEAIDSVMSGRDTVLIMPTSGGKSLVMQIPALMLDGVTIIVSPLIALMKDQVDALQAKGLPATFINSSLSQADYNERMDMIRAGEYKMVYVAPERFSNDVFMEQMAAVKVSLLASDEMHCVSQFGHNFRPDYLKIGTASKKLGRPIMLGLTATATPDVRRDCIKQLDMRDPQIFVDGFERPNLSLFVESVAGKEMKLYKILQEIKKNRTGIVYCSTRKNVEIVSERLKTNGIKHVGYHGGMKDDDRTAIQNKFMRGEAPVVVATNAFGMGIDRADLRFVIHYDIPGSVEAYYQEAGRAGRDGMPSNCTLIYDASSVRTQMFFVEGQNPTRDIVQSVYWTLQKLCQNGPINKPVSGEYRGIADDVKDVHNPLAVGGALTILAKHGAIRRWFAKGSRAYWTDIVNPIREIDDLGINFGALHAKYLQDTQRLNEVKSYAEQWRQCRQGFILDYFGEEFRKCGRCDICKGKA